MSEPRGPTTTVSEPWFDARERLALIDAHLDERVGERYKREPLAQDWARVGKVAEEMGEAIASLIAWTGQNPRKAQRDEARGELLNELADVALTGLLAIQHFTKDANLTLAYLDHRLALGVERMKSVNSQAKAGA